MNEDTDHHSRIRSQYSPGPGSAFYRSVMGDGAPVIHYGIYESESTLMREATAVATERLLAIARDRLGEAPMERILDLGAGLGGPAHYLAAQTGAMVTCVDLCEHHSQENEASAAKLGLERLIDTWTGSFESLPAEWNGRFDVVWSQEALCHAADPAAVLSEAGRVLRDGGIMVFSDILLAGDGSSEEASAFHRVNAVVKCLTVTEYTRLLGEAGFTHIELHDWTRHLDENFRRMRAQIGRHGPQLQAAGVPQDLLVRFAKSLDERLSWPSGSVLGWGVFCCSRPNE